MRTQRLIIYAFAACFTSLVGGSAMAQLNLSNPNSLLQGTYRYTMAFSCSRSGQFTDLPDLRPIGDGFGVTSHTTGFITYDGLGHAAVDQRGIVIFPAPTLSAQILSPSVPSSGTGSTVTGRTR